MVMFARPATPTGESTVNLVPVVLKLAAIFALTYAAIFAVLFWIALRFYQPDPAHVIEPPSVEQPQATPPAIEPQPKRNIRQW
jgi:hypothetical protein